MSRLFFSQGKTYLTKKTKIQSRILYINNFASHINLLLYLFMSYFLQSYLALKKKKNPIFKEKLAILHLLFADLIFQGKFQKKRGINDTKYEIVGI